MNADPLTADPIELLRRRTSTKWASYPDDVLPLFVAEMDYPIAPAIAAHLGDLIARSDLGYDSRRLALGEAFAGFARDRWDWDLDPAAVRATNNVMTAITELLRGAIEPGDRVLINSPVYPPFREAIAEVGGALVDAPLLEHAPEHWELDLDAIEAAFRGGVRAYLLCSPHNPIGIVHPREQLVRIAELAAEHGVLVLSDEIHAALSHSDTEFVPFLAVSDAAREIGVAVTSGTKAFNVAGLTAAWWVPGSKAAAERIAGVAPSVIHRVSHIGVHAATAGFTSARDWVDAAVATLELQRGRLRTLLDDRLPRAVLHEPRASYLAWIDLREYGWGDDPARRILRDARVALSFGPSFGEQGKGFARLNYACSPEVLTEAIDRIAAIAD